VIAGDENSASTKEIINALRKQFIPGKVLLLRSQKYNDRLFKTAPFTENQKPVGDKTTVYVCSDFICNNPVYTVEEMLKLIDS
jgi:uncharacterized protein